VPLVAWWSASAPATSKEIKPLRATLPLSMQAKDVTVYLEQNERLHLPGCGSLCVHPVPKVVVDGDDFKRLVAVRHTLHALKPAEAAHGPVQLPGQVDQTGANVGSNVLS
jgi:hypothetical protein